MCFSGLLQKQYGHSSIWLAESLASLKPLNGIQKNLTGSKISMSSSKFVVFRSIGKIRWPPWPLFGGEFFLTFPLNCWMEFNETWQEARPQRPLSSLCFSGRSEKTRWLLCPTRGPKGHISCTWVQCATFLTDRPGQPFLFTHRPEKHKLGKRREILLPVSSSCQVLLNSVQRFQRRSRKCHNQSEAGAAILFFCSAQKTQTW